MFGIQHTEVDCFRYSRAAKQSHKYTLLTSHTRNNNTCPSAVLRRKSICLYDVMHIHAASTLICRVCYPYLGLELVKPKYDNFWNDLFLLSVL